MSILIRSALIALVLTSAPVAMARPANNIGWTDMSKPYGGYDPNSPEGNRAFWDYIGQHGN